MVASYQSIYLFIYLKKGDGEEDETKNIMVRKMVMIKELIRMERKECLFKFPKGTKSQQKVRIFQNYKSQK